VSELAGDDALFALAGGLQHHCALKTVSPFEWRLCCPAEIGFFLIEIVDSVGTWETASAGATVAADSCLQMAFQVFDRAFCMMIRDLIFQEIREALTSS
jgi:hypothetical protein